MLTVDSDEVVEVAIDEAREDTSLLARTRREGEEVGEHLPGVPVKVAVAARLVLPRRSPEDPRESEHGLGFGEARVICRGCDEAAQVARAQWAKRSLERVEVVETRRELGEIRAGRVHLDRVQRARARVGAEVVRLRPEAARANDSGAPAQEPGEVVLLGERDGFETGVLLERVGPVVPVEQARAATDALEGVLRPLVVAAGRVRVTVHCRFLWGYAR